MYLPEREPISVAPKTVQAVLESVLCGDAHTRNQIAEQRQVSSMTVGKVIRMLCRTELLSEREMPSLRGRYPLCLVPSQRLHSVILYLSDATSLVALYASDGGLLARLIVPHQHSLPPEGNLATLRSHCDRLLRQRNLPDTGLGIGIILGCNFTHRNYHQNLLQSILPSEAIKEEDSLIIKELSRPTYGRTVLYISLEKTIRTMLLIDGKNSDLFPWDRDPLTAVEDPRSELLQSIAGTARVALPNTVIIEGDVSKDGEAARLLAVLSERIPEPLRETIRTELLPEHTVAERGMRRCLCHRYAERWITS